MERKTFERALHNWPDWHDSIEQSRNLLGYDPNWPKDKCLLWIEDNVKAIRTQGESELNRLELPPVLLQYWADCFYSNYRDNDGNINLKMITSCLSNSKSKPELPCEQRIVWYEDEDIHSPWIRVEIFIHSRFATKELFNYASRYDFKTLKGELFWRSLEPHPITQWLGGGRPPIDEEIALECARLADEDDWTESKIGNKYGWALQEDNYGKLSQCRAARRYIKRGRELKKKHRT